MAQTVESKPRSSKQLSGQPGTALGPFSIQKTPASPHGRAVVPLVRTDVLVGNLQILNEGGGERQHHCHTGMDGFWMVLKGRARFYGPEHDTVAAELGPMEGIVVPRNCTYWFECVGSEQLHLLQLEAIDKTVENKFIAHGPKIAESHRAPRIYLEGEAPAA